MKGCIYYCQASNSSVLKSHVDDDHSETRYVLILRGCVLHHSRHWNVPHFRQQSYSVTNQVLVNRGPRQTLDVKTSCHREKRQR